MLKLKPLKNPGILSLAAMILLFVCPEIHSQKNSIIPVTVNILKARTDNKFINPEVTFISNSEGCTIRNEAGWTGETPSEYYFTVNVPSEKTAPIVLVDMKGFGVRRVIMPGQANAEFEVVDGKVKIELVKRAGNIRHLWSSWTDQHRTDIQFPWNCAGRRDGRYADPEPLYENRNLAHIAYAIGAREVYREWDITNYLEKNFPGKGDAAAVGYENNFPRAHEDYPPHIHIWFKWPDWRGYNTHLYPDDNGQVHSCWVIAPDNERSYPKAGEWQEKKDDREMTVFYVRYTRKGTIEMQKAKDDPVYALKINAGDVKGMTVLKKGKPIKTIRIADFDPAVARLVIESCDLRTNRMRVETLITDPDTAGGKRQIEETDCK